MGGFYMKMSNVKTSTVAKSAYNSRTKEYDETQNHTFNYSAKEDHVYHNVTLPDGCPEEWKQAEKLWNENEKFETEQNTTRHGKQFIVAIPQELTQEQTEKAINEFQEYFAKMGYASQADQHEPESRRSADEVEKNRHVHVLTTARKITNGEFEQIKEKKMFANDRDANGKPVYNPEKPDAKDHKEYRVPVLDENGEQKFRERPGKGKEMLWERVRVQDNPLDRRETVEAARAEWARICNSYLSEDQKIDHRSYERQGSERVAEIHEGIGSHKEQDDRKAYNEEVRQANAKLEQAKQAAETRLKEKGESHDNRESQTVGGDHRGADGVGGRAESGQGQTTSGADRGAESPRRDVQAFGREESRLDAVKERFSRFTEEARQGVDGNRKAFDGVGEQTQDGSGRAERPESGEQAANGKSRRSEELYRDNISGIRREQQGIKGSQLEESFRNDRVGRQVQHAFERVGELRQHVGERFRDGIARLRTRLERGFRGVLERSIQKLQATAETVRQEQPRQAAQQQSPLSKLQQAQAQNAAAQPRERSEDMSRSGVNSLLAQAKAQNQAADQKPQQEESRTSELLKSMQEQKAAQEWERNEQIISEALKHMDESDREKFKDGHELNDQERDYLEKKYCQQKGTFNEFDDHGRMTGKKVDRMYTPYSERDMNDKQKAVYRFIKHKPKESEEEKQQQTIQRSYHR